MTPPNPAAEIAVPPTLPDGVPQKVGALVHVEPIQFVLRARAAAADGAESAADDAPEDPVFDVILSTETPDELPWATEILSHDKSAVDLSKARRGVAMYMEHGGWPYRPTADPLMHIGIVEDLEVSNGQLRGKARFSDHELAQRVRADVEKG